MLLLGGSRGVARTIVTFCEVDMPNSNIATMWTPIFVWYVVMCGFELRTNIKMTCISKLWTTCSKYAYYSRSK